MNAVLLTELNRIVRERATGAVEWRVERKRRLFFFRHGSLVLIQSNLKSESPERVRETQPGLTTDAVAFATAALRLRDALAEPIGELTFHPDAPAPGFEAHELAALLWQSAPPSIPPGVWPRVTVGSAALARIPIETGLLNYLTELDGSRPLEDVLEFAPADEEIVSRAIAIGHILGAIDYGAPPATRAVSAPVQPKPTPAPKRADVAPITVDDLADLIRGAITESEEPPAARPAAGERSVASERPAPTEAAAQPFGGGSAIVTLPSHRPVEAPPQPSELEAKFGGAMSRIKGAKDHFAVLGTNWQDPPETHRRAYLALAQRLHPDRVTGESEEVRRTAEELFDLVRAAWEVLGSADAREAYIARVIRGEKSEDEQAMDRVRAIMDAEADFKRGIAELNGGRLPSAHELFQKAARILPDDLELGAYAAFTSFKLAHGRDDAAAREAAKKVASAVQANEKLDNVWVLYGIVLRMSGNEAAARRAFVSALKQRPTNPDAAREMKRLDREKDAATEAEASGGGLFSRFFKKK